MTETAKLILPPSGHQLDYQTKLRQSNCAYWMGSSSRRSGSQRLRRRRKSRSCSVVRDEQPRLLVYPQEQLADSNAKRAVGDSSEINPSLFFTAASFQFWKLKLWIFKDQDFKI
jgi:hypothetical protein